MGGRRWLPFALISVGTFTIAALGAASACSSFSSDGEAKEDTGIGTVVDGGTDGNAEASVDAASPLPVDLIGGQGKVRRLAVRGGVAYWAIEDGTIRACRIDMCAGTVRTIAAGYNEATPPTGLTVDGEFVYWTGYLNSIVFRAPIDGTNVMPEVFAQFDKGSGHRPFGIVVDATTVFWASESPDEVRSCPTNGPCGDGGVVVSTSQGPFTRRIAMNDSSIAWLVGDGDQDGGAAFRTPKSGGGPTPVSYDIPGPRGIAIVENAVFVTSWLDTGGTPGPGTVYRCFAPADRSSFATNQAQPTSIAADKTHVYWANQGDGTIQRCPVSGCAPNPTTVARDQGVPESIVVADTSVYWLDAVSGRVVSLKK